jgi:hypothetical protein
MKTKYTVGSSGWFPVEFENWNNFAEGSDGGKLDATINGENRSYYVGFGPEVNGAEANFLKNLMKYTYAEDKASKKLDDPNAETPTGHA